MHTIKQSFDEIDPLFHAIAGAQVEITNEAKVPDKIYHFTDYKGLQGILESKTLWLSDIFSMNDPSELSYGFEMADRAIAASAAGAQGPSATFLSAAKDFIQHRSFEEIADYLAVCFSKDPNDLDQWRSYGDNGQGFCLEFDGKVLEKHFIDPKSFQALGHTYHIRYDTDTLERAVNDMVMLAKDLAARNTYALQGLLDAFTLNLVLVSLMFKHTAYKREGEVRFMQISLHTSPHIQKLHRLKPFELVKYAKFDWAGVSTKALKRIIVGPAAPQKADKFAGDCRAIYLGQDHPCRTERVTIPYRI